MAKPVSDLKTKRKQLFYRFVFILLLLLGINIMAYQWYAQIDLTQDKRYSTTEATKKMLNQLGGDVTVTVFLKSKSLPAAFKSLAISTEELLKTFVAESGHKVNYKFVDPTEDETALSTLEKFHMSGIPVTISDDGGTQNRMVFPWALVTYTSKGSTDPRTAPVLLQESNSMVLSKTILLRSEVLLEYNLGNAIQQLQKDHPEFLAYVLGNQEAIPPFITSLINNVGLAHFAMDTLSLQANGSIPAKYKALVICQPKSAFSDIDLFKIDQYIMNGGNVLFAVDATLSSIDSFQTQETFTAEPLDLGLNNLLFSYGARVNKDLVLDASSNSGIPVATGGNAQTQMYSWPYYPVLEGNSASPITKNLEGVMARFPASIDLMKTNDATVKKTALLTTSIYGKKIGLPALVMYKSIMEEPNLATYNSKNLVVAALLEGSFVSPFIQNQSAELQSYIDAQQLIVKSQSKKSKIIVLSDADILLNEVKQSGEPMEMGGYRFSPSFRFDNAAFFQNALTYLIDDNNLLAARAKTFQNRILDPKLVEAERGKWQLLAIGLPIALVGLLGLIYSFLRKRKYAQK